ncbi:phage protein [Raoultella ornithinolytica]|uniref:phage protein n=1 Tax=Raoultella ornithinolytica TaxID=54291 RepID=UPI000E586B3F|nr:phage protein [Raoultella ornithinolytica]
MYLGVMSSKDWLITVGVVPVIGLAKDSNITLEMTDDQITVSSGIGGDWSFIDNPTEEGSLTFITQRNSPVNTALFLMQKTKSVVPVTLTNTRNLSVHRMSYAMFARQPTDGANNGAGAQTLEWKLVTGEVDSVINGVNIT